MRALRDAFASDVAGSTTPQRPIRLRIGQRCRVEGVLHAYLGPAYLNGEAELVHVFARREWRPGTPGQLPVSLVRDPDLADLVIPIQRSLLS